MKWCALFAILVLALIGCSTDVDRGTSSAGAQSVSADERTPDAEGFVPISAANHADFLTSFGDGREKDRTLIVSHGTDGESFQINGDGRGYIYTKKPYKNFTLRFDVRWPTAGDLPEDERSNANTGVLVFITGEHKVWPKCLEVQGKWSELAHIKSNAKDVSVTVHDDEDARQKARKPVGEWNSLEIVAKDGALTSYLNGTKIAESEPTELVEGPIGFQAERYDVEFRNVRIREE